ncbi:MAG: MBL fold metallo-hydrolase [Bacteroidales bacterium]|jgi:L-ascorbate metabolism protein UlaG (beta-lactamase superfamily)
MKIRLYRNATILLKYEGKSFLIDPYFAEEFSLPSYTGKSKNPMVGLPVTKEKILEDIDTVIISHLHSDHFDSVAQKCIPKNMPILCQIEDSASIKKMGFTNVTEISKTYNLGKITIERISGQHGTGEVLKDMGIVSGFYFSSEDEPDLYWTGDTILTEEIKKVLKQKGPSVVITHSCGAEWGDHVKIVMDEYQTIEVCKLLPKSVVIATHMDTLDHSTVSRIMLRQFAQENEISENQLRIPADGELISI